MLNCRSLGFSCVWLWSLPYSNMAGNKINSKGSKSREDKVKSNKVVTQSSEDCEDPDFTLLRKPIHTSITGFAQARKIFDWATEELKDLLSNECDLLYECKVCRNIFRSLANFISHKRVYCKEKFNSYVHAHFMTNNSMVNEFLKIKNTEDGYQESLKQTNDPIDVDDIDKERIPMSKDLTEIIEKIAMVNNLPKTNEHQQVVLQKIPSSSVAVFQSVSSVQKQADLMKAQVNELDKILSQDKAVLQMDGKFTVESSNDNDMEQDPGSIIQISDDDDNNTTDVLKCKICNLQFSTQKTLKFHMKYKHLESRLVYPCPDCLEIFSTSWSVYRHLFKVHRKTAAQIRRLRESIQAKAFKKNNPPAFYEKRKNNMKPVIPQKITEEERLDQENQAWMDNMEGDGEVPRCGGCGRGFERRAALAAHTHTCQPRSRALQRAGAAPRGGAAPALPRRQDHKKIEIQIRKDYDKGPAALSLLKSEVTNEKLSNDEQQTSTKSTENIESKNEENYENLSDDNPMDIADEEKSNDSTESTEKTEETKPEIEFKPVIRLPFAMLAEKSNLAAFTQRVKSDIDVIKIACKKCNITHKNLSELFEHMAEHYKWMRYACKLCNFKHYNFLKLPEHVKVVHKLKGDTDFYFSTIKAIDGTEAMLSSKCLVDSEVDEVSEVNETSPESRRPSRCSSDSSRLSDDSNSSSTIKETTGRKRKLNQSKILCKRKKDTINEEDNQKDGEISNEKTPSEKGSAVRMVEENSSDMDDIEDKLTKRYSNESITSVASRRPVRKKTKPKNEDFEYDLSNLLKKEAQGYRDSQSTSTSKAYLNKKKTQVEVPNINKDHSGALFLLSKKAVELAAAQIKTASFIVFSGQREPRTSNIFVKPLPKLLAKSSPKKDNTEDSKVSSPTKLSKAIDPPIPTKENAINKPSINDPINDSNLKSEPKDENSTSDPILKAVDDNTSREFKSNKDGEEIPKEETSSEDNAKKKVSAVVPVTLRRQSIDIIKNPSINKSITDFNKAGMKTKILVIKPINRSKDANSKNSTPLKFQTIKLKDANKSSSSSEDKSSDQVMVVKVPKVDCAMSRPVLEKNTIHFVENNEHAAKNSEGEVDKPLCDNNEKINDSCDNNDTVIATNDATKADSNIKPAGSEIVEVAS